MNVQKALVSLVTLLRPFEGFLRYFVGGLFFIDDFFRFWLFFAFFLFKDLTPEETENIVAFLKTLSGSVSESARTVPELPLSAPMESHPNNK